MEYLNLATESFTTPQVMNVGMSHAILEAVSQGHLGPTFRLHAASRILAFGMADRIQPGYRSATRIAEAHGFAPIERLAGGRAAVFHEDTVAFSWAIPENDPRTGIADRFRQISGLLNSAFRALGLDSRIGQVPGEYCPGEYSINIGGKVKVMGVGQRLVKGAAHVGGVIVVDGARRIKEVLIPTYRALGVDWDPRTTGALADRAPGLSTAQVVDTVRKELETRYTLNHIDIPQTIMTRARELSAGHIPEVAG